jgi:two-component system, sensor histidine kinase and response regulator
MTIITTTSDSVPQLLSDNPDVFLHLTDDDDSPATLPEGTPHVAHGEQHEKRRTLLLVDDETMLLEVLRRLFQALYNVVTAESGNAALILLENGCTPEVIIADQRMPGMQGPEFLAQSREFMPSAVRIILTGYTDVQDIIESINRGYVYRFITKPWNSEELLETVRISFEHYDISTRNNELTVALAKLAELNREKSELMGIVAHDLKNPIGAVQTLSDMMLMDDESLDAEERTKFLRLINGSSARALELINSVLSLEAIEQGGIRVQCETLDLAPVLQELVQQYTPLAEKKSIRLHLHVPQKQMVLADAQILQQVVDNILSNAVKYSPPGKKVWIQVQTCLDEKYRHSILSRDALNTHSHDTVFIIVQDEGPGFTEADKAKLFGKFTRLSAQPTGGETSTGLGLSIVKRFVEAMQGQIWVVSEAGKGAAFVVALPVPG